MSRKALNIFKAGTHTAMNGKVIEFSVADLAATAGAYDPDLHEAPIVVGHPTHDKPAYGWIEGVTAKGGQLYATPRQVEPAFAEMVADGRFKKLSASFYQPDHANNPVPGVWYLKHVGALGAAAPAVQGLKNIEFGDGSDGVTVELDLQVAFADFDFAYAMARIARILRGLRDWIIDKDGQETADKVMDGWDLDHLQQDAGEAMAKARQEFDAPRFAAAETSSTTTQENSAMSTPTPAPAPGADATALEQRQRELEAREAAFAERQRLQLRETNAAFLDELVKQAKVPAGVRAAALAFMESLDDDKTASFGEGDAAIEGTQLSTFKRLFEQLPGGVAFGEVAKPEEAAPATAEFAAPDGYSVDPEKAALAKRIEAHMKANPGVSFVEAATAVKAG